MIESIQDCTWFDLGPPVFDSCVDEIDRWLFSVRYIGGDHVVERKILSLVDRGALNGRRSAAVATEKARRKAESDLARGFVE